MYFTADILYLQAVWFGVKPWSLFDCVVCFESVVL